jgi:hypothetical protein
VTEPHRGGWPCLQTELKKSPFQRFWRICFSEDLIAENRRYWQLERGLKLRAALLVFFYYGLAQRSDADKSSALIILPDVGLAQPSEADKSLPMWVPTRHFIKLVETSRLTTLVKPLHLPASIDISRRESGKYYCYSLDFERSLDEGVPKYCARMRALLRVSELVWMEHKRRDDGRLCWNLTQSGIESLEDGTMDKLLSGERYGKN